MRAALLILLLPLAGCATDGQTPPLEPKIEYRDVPTPVPVPCFAAADKPPLPTPVPVDVDNATPDQIAAANEADLRALRLYAEAMERLTVNCPSKGTP